MKILVVIASYGDKNSLYLRRIINEYRAMPHEVDIVVLSNEHKDLGSDIEISVGLPTSNPHSLPFAHKAIFAERSENYDLFIYSEDDILISRKNISAFIEVTNILPAEKIAGFMRYEVYSDGMKNFDCAHHKYRWLPGSAVTIGGEIFAHFTNTHSGCYILTKSHLQRAIRSGGFLVMPPVIKYGLLELCATQPYTQCGYEKLICISRLDDFLVHHLPNVYLDRLGTAEKDMLLQIAALKEIAQNKRSVVSLCVPEKNSPFDKWSKNYHEHGGEEIFKAIHPDATKILNVGGVIGITERLLIEQGKEVTSIPIDPVIASCLTGNGIRTTSSDFKTALNELRGEKFDCILMIGIIQHLSNPVFVLSSLRELLSSGGAIILSAPDINALKLWLKTLGKRKNWWRPISYPEIGLHLTCKSTINRWLRKSGLCNIKTIPNSDRKKIVVQCSCVK